MQSRRCISRSAPTSSCTTSGSSTTSSGCRASSSPSVAGRWWRSTTSRPRARPESAIRDRALDESGRLARDLRAQRRGAGGDGAVRRDAGRQSMRWCSRSPPETSRWRRSSSRNRWSREESALDHAIEAAGLTCGRNGSRRVHPADQQLRAPLAHHRSRAAQVAGGSGRALPRRRTALRVKTGIEELCLEARGVLRQHYLTADMGISGGNFFVAESGSVVLVTNEGNATLTTTLPKVHVAISGIEKIVPTLEDVATLMRLLPRSATGQSISNYVDVLTGPQGRGRAPRRRAHVLHRRRLRPHRRARRATFATRCAASDAARA